MKSNTYGWVLGKISPLFYGLNQAGLPRRALLVEPGQFDIEEQQLAHVQLRWYGRDWRAGL